VVLKLNKVMNFTIPMLDKPNKNNRVYPKALLEKELKRSTLISDGKMFLYKCIPEGYPLWYPIS
jgi:hypothetical protein